MGLNFGSNGGLFSSLQDSYYVEDEDEKNRVKSVVKPGNTTITNDSSLNNDPHLFLSVEANTVYNVLVYLEVDVDSDTPDIELELTAPGSGLFSVTVGSSLKGYSPFNDYVSNNASLAMSSSIINNITLSGTLITTSSGTVQLQWCQDTSSSYYTRVMTGSFLNVTKA